MNKDTFRITPASFHSVLSTSFLFSLNSIFTVASAYTGYFVLLVTAPFSVQELSQGTRSLF